MTCNFGSTRSRVFGAKKLQWVGNDSLAFQREFRRPATGLANTSLWLCAHLGAANPLDFIGAINCWDSGNLAVFQAWVSQPMVPVRLISPGFEASECCRRKAASRATSQLEKMDARLGSSVVEAMES